MTATAGRRDSAARALRVFTDDASGGSWTETTAGRRPVVRLAAEDLQQAQRGRRRLRAENALHGRDVAVILDVTVFIAHDFRAARAQVAGHRDSLAYGGSIDGLAGLIGDIFVADVADGVTLVPAVAGLDVRGWADAVVARLARRLPVAA